jgi:hypothetical protein
MYSRHLSAKWAAISESYSTTPQGGSHDYAADARNTARLEAGRRAAMAQLLVAVQSVESLEAKLQITEPWTENHSEYKATLGYIQQRDYHRILDKIQRLFELSKANVMGMGTSIFQVSQVLRSLLCCFG